MKNNNADMEYEAFMEEFGDLLTDDSCFVIDNGMLLFYLGDENTVEIPEGVTTIYSRAFCNNLQLLKVYIPASVKYVGIEAFSGCENLTDVVFEEGALNNIDTGVFANCVSLREISLPGSLKRIGPHVFSGCSALEKIMLPEALRCIECGAFSGCRALRSVRLPAGLREIGAGRYADPVAVFAGCESLHTVTVAPENPCFAVRGRFLINKETRMVQLAFPGAAELPMDPDITGIAECAFVNNMDLINLRIPENIVRIGRWAFFGCENLKRVSIPSGVKLIKPGAFANCPHMEAFFVDAENSFYKVQGNCLIRKDGKTLIAGCKNSSIPDDGSVTAIAAEAFYGCEGLKELRLPAGLSSVGAYAFFGCGGLEKIELPDSVRNIELFAFANCGRLETVILPRDLFSIGERAFSYNNNLKNVVFTGVVPEKIDDSAFRNCPQIRFYCNMSDINLENMTFLSKRQFLLNRVIEIIKHPESKK